MFALIADSQSWTYTKKLITERVRMLAHFTIGDQFIGFSGSSVSGSAHHTLKSEGEAGVGAVAAVGMGLFENSLGVCEGAILVLQWCATRNQTIPSTTNEDGLLEIPKILVHGMSSHRRLLPYPPREREQARPVPACLVP